jgi:hypothetical protein
MIEQRLLEHVFEPQTWLPQAGGDKHVARYYQSKAYPLAQFQKADYLDSFTGRLVLLSDAEWHLLGFSCAVMPFAGKLANNLNGRLRRALKAYFADELVLKMDQLPNDCSFLLTPDCWDDRLAVAKAGIAAILCELEFSNSQQNILALRFEKTCPAISNLTISLVEDLCKISLPNLPWLLPEAPLA